MMNRDDEFEKWYKMYFKDSLSPYSYNDINVAYFAGWKRNTQTQTKR